MTTNYHPQPPTEASKVPANRLEMVKQMAATGGSFGLAAEGRKVVHIGQIDEDPQNERKTFRNLDGLAASISTFGVLEPPTVFEKPDGRLQILTGHRRFRAARMAGVEKLEVLVRKADEEKIVRKKSIVSNVQREDVNPIELANALQSLLDDNEVTTQSALAEVIGKDKTWVSKMLRILSLPTPLQEKVATSQLLVSYDAVAEIARLDNPKKQASLIEFLLSGGSVHQVREQIKGDKEGTNSEPELPGKKPKYVFLTKQGATVIIQSLGVDELSEEQKVSALKEALKTLR